MTCYVSLLGKTTLLNLVMGKLQTTSRILFGQASIAYRSFFSQQHDDNFDLSISAIENMLNMLEGSEDQEMRTFLGKFQIQGNDALKPMGLLNGGQKSRVAFVALAYKRSHVLIIDEGSNHLSMDAVDALVEAEHSSHFHGLWDCLIREKIDGVFGECERRWDPSICRNMQGRQ